MSVESMTASSESVVIKRKDRQCRTILISALRLKSLGDLAVADANHTDRCIYCSTGSGNTTQCIRQYVLERRVQESPVQNKIK
eukprot:scaffold142088_cov20-Prasinocladus_malaysianus.AAC.1